MMIEPASYFSSPSRGLGHYEAILSALPSGISHFVSIAAVNDIGTGEELTLGPIAPGSVPTPVQLTVSTILASDVVSVADSAHSLVVNINNPDDGGFPVLDYTVEWWLANNDFRHEVQVIQASAPGALPSGSFRLGLDGYSTDWVPVDSSAIEMASELKALPTIRDLQVTRSDATSGLGYVWTVKFLSDLPSGPLFVIESDLFGASGASVTIGHDLVSGLPGNEGVATATVVAGSNSVTVAGDVGGISAGLWIALDGEEYLVADTPSPTEIILNESYKGAALSLVSAPYGSTVPGKRPSSHDSLVIDSSTETQLISGLEAGELYIVRATSRNTVGNGTPVVSAPIAPLRQAPSSPREVQAFPASSTSLRVLWLSSESDGGSAISKYKIEWELEGTVVGSHLKLASECTDGAPCEHVVGSLVKGKQYAIRVHAYNAHGFSLKGGEASETPCTVASPPSLVNVRASGLLTAESGEYSTSYSSLAVEFGPSADDGGKPVTSYKIEWDALELLAYDYGASSSSLLYSQNDMYSVMVTASENDISGTWRAEVGGYATGPISAVADKVEVQTALNSLPTVGEVSVIRRAAITSPGYGYEWIISRRATSCFDTTEVVEGTVGKCSEIRVSTDANAAPGSFGASALLGTLSGTNPEVSSQPIVVGLDGFEQQAVTLEVDTGYLGGTFVLSLQGYSTTKLTWDISAFDMEKALLPIAGKVMVRRTVLDTDRSIRWNVVFLDLVGNVSPLEVDASEILKTDFGASLSQNVKKIRTSTLPAMESALRGSMEVQEPGEVVIGNLVPGALYHVTVSSYNGVSLVWGPRKAATPVAISASLPFMSPLGVVAVPSSSSILNVSWSPPFTPEYGMPPSMYKVDWGSAPGISEIQRVTISGTGAAMGGTFRLKFEGATTLPIAWNADASTVEDALNALPTIGLVLVQKPLPGEWLVTFVNNVGDLPMISGLSTMLTPSTASVSIDEVVAGMNPPFDQGAVGLTPLPLGSSIIEPLPALQEITITASAGDLHGTFIIVFEGISSLPISVAATASEVQRILEGVPTIGEVVVVREDVTSSSPPFLERRGYRWLVTLTRYSSGLVPSMLVSTQSGTIRTTGSSGTLLGSFPIVEVTTVREGGLSQSLLVELDGSDLQPTTGTVYFTRVSAHSTSHGWGDFAVAPISTIAESKPPSPPKNVVAGVLSDSTISMSWEPPAINGGVNVTEYTIQWSGDKAFTSTSEIIAPTTSLSCVITGLTSGQQQYVRVLARNSIGFSKPTIAVSRSSHEVQRIDLIVGSGGAACIVSGTLTFSTTHPVTLQPISVGPLSFEEDGISLANALQLEAEAPIRAVRTDSSLLDGYDTSGVSTADLSIHYLVSFDDGFDWPELDITIGNCAGASSTVTTVMNGGGGIASLTPTRLPPTPPENVYVSVVSSDSLGVTWDPPAYTSNSLSVTKYLVEWEAADPGFMQSTIGPSVSHSEAAIYSEVVVGLKYQILGLDEGTPYYVRVRAFTVGDGYGPPATFSSPIIPTSRPAHTPNNVRVTISDNGAPDQLIVSWDSPSVDGETQLFQTDNGGAPITHYVILYAPVRLDLPSMEESTLSMRALGLCPVSCNFPLGAEVQSVSIYNEIAGSGITSGEFVLKLPNGATSSCISYGDDIYAELSSLLDPGVKVAKEAITVPGIGEKYWITFAGERLSGNYDGLIEFEESSSCSST